jgi:hypothetical protein
MWRLQETYTQIPENNLMEKWRKGGNIYLGNQINPERKLTEIKTRTKDSSNFDQIIKGMSWNRAIIKDGKTTYKQYFKLMPTCIDWECLGTGCWGGYLDRRGMRWRENGENCITRSFVICTLHQV